jgi:hypothetical protein
MTMGTQKVVGMHRGKIGMCLMHQSRGHLHYEEEALKLNLLTIASQIYNIRGNPYHFCNDGWNFFS